MNNPRFRTKVFIGAVAAATLSLLVAALLLSWEVRTRERAAIDEQLVREARAVAELLPVDADAATLEREASRIGRLIGRRVTLIAEDGQVVADSTQTSETLDR